MTSVRKLLTALFVLVIGGDWVSAQKGGDTASVAEAPKSLVDLPLEMESQPYRVRLLIADEAQDSDLTADLGLALARSAGALWQASFGKLEHLPRCDGEALNRWQVSEMPQRFAEADVDFFYAVTVHRRGSQRRIAVRAWQPQFDWLSPVHEDAFYEPRETAGRIVKLCWGLFRPQVLVEHVDENSCRVRIPAGDLQPADPEFQLFQPGDCLIPWLMYYDRDRSLKKKQELPWTYVRLDEIAGPSAQGTVLSGLRSALGGKTRGRIDKVAVASRPVYPQTRLQVGVQNQPARSLAGYRLEVRPKLPERKAEPAAEPDPKEDKDEEEIVKLLTDRLGEVRLTPDPAQQSVWVYVYSGDLLLARVPFVPGSSPFLRLDVPDDSIRLQVEGDLQSLQNELINQVAERNTLIAAARNASKKGDWQRVAVLRKQLEGLPSKSSFQEKLAGIRVPAINAAKARKDRAGQVRIERLCKDVNELIGQYLNADRIKQVLEELEMLEKDAKVDEKP